MTFARALSLTSGSEGGYSNIPADKGGVTYRGVTQMRFSAWLRANGQEDRDVITMTDAEYQSLAFACYWTPSHAADCPEATGCMQFDASFNHGPANAIRLLQDAVGVEIDGAWGPETASAVTAADDQTLLATFLQVRATFYREIVIGNPSQGIFLQGWLNRLDRLQKALCTVAPSFG